MTDGLLSLSWNNHKATFCHILSTLREKERYTDVTLACDGKIYQAHRFVLSTCSEYFEKMIDSSSCKHPVIVLPKEVKCDELEALLSYMYDGVVSVAQNDLTRLIKVAELLQIKGLAVPDEPPTSKQGYSWSACDDRSSPPPKRRRREQSQSGDIRNTSDPHSPSAQEGDQERGVNTEVPTMEVTPDMKYKHESDTVQNEENEEETLVKEEIVETVDSTPNEEAGVDNRMQPGESTEYDSSANKYQALTQSQPLHEAVVEALAGPSGMQGWLGTGDMGPGFPILESYSEEGSQDTQPVPVSGAQQPHQMVGCQRRENTQDKNEGGETLRCSQCSFASKDKAEMLKHMHTHDAAAAAAKRFHCEHCSYRSSNRGNLIQHVRRHTGEKPFHCMFCDYRATQKCHLEQHLVRHLKPKK